jgi:site-specific recombinase
MWTIATSAMALFFRGRLFAEPAKAYRLLALGGLATALLFIALALAGLPLWAASLLAGFIGGGAQPFLFKNIRYR